jgi:hypothetical protein
MLLARFGSACAIVSVRVSGEARRLCDSNARDNDARHGDGVGVGVGATVEVSAGVGVKRVTSEMSKVPWSKLAQMSLAT